MIPVRPVTPISAMISRTSRATARKYAVTPSTVPRKRARNFGSCVAIPVGQVLAWHCLTMTHPAAIITAVPNPELIRSEERGNDHVPAGAHAAVGPHPYPVAQAVVDQDFLRLGEPDLPVVSRVLDGTDGCRAGAPFAPAYLDDVGVGLGNACGNGPYPGLCHELDADVGFGVRLFQVMDELGQVFDGVDIVVGRGRDEQHVRRAMPEHGDIGIHLDRREVAAFSGFCSLRYLDLQVRCRGQVGGGHAEPAGGHLFHGAVLRTEVPRRVFTALAAVAPDAEAVAGLGNGFVRLGREGPYGHGACHGTA